MILTEQNMAFYLMDKGYLPAQQLVDGKFRVDSSDSRNKNFIVNKDYDNAYFIKHVRDFDNEKTSTLRTEATCYWLANNDSHYATLKSFLPTYHSFDYINYVLMLGYEKGNVSLYDFYQRQGIGIPGIADKLGRLLSSYHKGQSADEAGNEAKKFFKRQKPWVFSLGNAPHFNNGPADQKAQQQVIRLVLENKQYQELIRGLEDQWVYESLIHNDIKFHNLLVKDQESSDVTIKLIDWELADIGDPCWDVAALFQSYLTLWVAYETMGKQGLDFSLSKIQPAIRSFWEAYAGNIDFDKPSYDDQLIKCIHYCALKLIHTSLETTTGAPSLSPYGAKLLQLSFNILRSPKEARYNLFGIR